MLYTASCCLFTAGSEDRMKHGSCSSCLVFDAFDMRFRGIRAVGLDFKILTYLTMLNFLMGFQLSLQFFTVRVNIRYQRTDCSTQLLKTNLKWFLFSATIESLQRNYYKADFIQNLFVRVCSRHSSQHVFDNIRDEEQRSKSSEKNVQLTSAITTFSRIINKKF